MPLFIVENDITKMRCDAIVNAANSSLLGGGGVDGAIHAAAGPRLLAECRTLGGCATGEAKLTAGYDLPAKHVIHTVGPVWRGGGAGEEELLRSCYRSSLRLAERNAFESVAFPLISAGAYGYPKRAAFNVALEEISEFLRSSDMTVYVVMFRREEAFFDADALGRLTAYIDERQQSEQTAFFGAAQESEFYREESEPGSDSYFGVLRRRPRPARRESDSAAGRFAVMAVPAAKNADAPAGLVDSLRDLDESFSQSLLRRIDEKGMTDVECYKRANVDRKLFSKIRGDAAYRPSKQTAVAFAIALRLTRDETDDLLKKAGFALSRSSKFDVIIAYFIARGEYDVNRVNEALFTFDQPLLGY